MSSITWKRIAPFSDDAFAVYVGIAVLVIVGLTFSPLLTAGIVHPQDRAFSHEMTRPAGIGLADVKAAFTRARYPESTGGYYAPLTSLSILLDNRLAGFIQHRAFQYHLTNLLLHGLNTVIVFVLLRQLGCRVAIGAGLSLLFGLHPLATASVASVAHRMTLLGSFLSLLALICYLHHARRDRHAGWLMLTTLFYSSACLSMPLFAALPVLFLIFDHWPLNRAAPRALLEKAPLFGLGLTFAVVQASIRLPAPSNPISPADPMNLLVQTAGSFVSRVFRPERLCGVYPISPELGGRFTALGLIVICLAMAAWMVSFRYNRAAFWALAGTAVLVAPSLLEIPYSQTLLGDAPLYPLLIMPLLGLGTLPVFARNAAPSGSTSALAVSLIGLASVLGVSAYSNAFTWQTSRDLYEHVTRRYPDWSPGYVKLVEADIAENELDAALIHAEKAAKLAPDDPSTQFYLGTVLLLHGDSRCGEAIVPLRAALASNTSWIECLQNLGVALARSGNLLEAIAHLEKARNLSPDSVGIRIGLGNAYLSAHRAASARREFQEALRLRSEPEIHLGLAVAWAANDVLDLARKHLEAAVAGDVGMAARAGRYPELQRLRNEPGFAQLLDLSTEAKSANAPKAQDLETAASAHGS